MDYQYLTLFFSKQTGKICSYCASEKPQDMSYFGDNEKDFVMIWDYIVIEYDPFLMKNIEFLRVDTQTKTLVSEQLIQTLNRVRSLN